MFIQIMEISKIYFKDNYIARNIRETRKTCGS
jgi:hypothetical protein